MKLKKFSAAALAVLTVTMMSAAPVLAADDIEVNEDISVSGDYDWKRFANDHITLNVYNNGLYISDGSDESINVLSAFEELTGIKVNYTTYDSNESLYAKLKSGGVSYDVIFPSDYMVGKMVKEGMLSELNMDNIPNFAGIGETYLDRSFDPGNKYSVPYMWGTTGLIYNTTMVEEPPTKWADMWDVAYTNNVLMFNNSRDAYAIAAKTIAKAVVMIGEIGGSAEQDAAKWASEHMTKPVVAYIAGFTAPEGKQMGHAGAIVSGGKGTAQDKKEALEAVGIRVGRTPGQTAEIMREVLASQSL